MPTVVRMRSGSRAVTSLMLIGCRGRRKRSKADHATAGPVQTPTSGRMMRIPWTDPAATSRRQSCGGSRRARTRPTRWRRWGAYLSERQWGTVREDYSADGDGLGRTCPTTTPARGPTAGARTACSGSATTRAACASRSPCGTAATRSSRSGSSALSGPEGNHGEDVKELYCYLDATPDRQLPQGALPLPAGRVPVRRPGGRERRRGRGTTPSTSWSTPACSPATASSTSRSSTPRPRPRTSPIRYHGHQSRAEPATLHLLPTLWFRNTWAGAATRPARRSWTAGPRWPLRACSPAIPASGGWPWSPTTAPSCSSPTTRRTPNGSSGRRMRVRTSRTGSGDGSWTAPPTP